MQPPPPRLEALVLKHASVLLPRTFPEHSGALRAHPAVRLALDLGELLTRLDEMHGRSPPLAAAALLALGFAANGGARGAAAAADAAALLGFDRHAVQAHARDFEAKLEELRPLLPFAAKVAPRAQLAHYAPLLLRLQRVVERTEAVAAAAGREQSAAQAAAAAAAAAASAAGQPA